MYEVMSRDISVLPPFFVRWRPVTTKIIYGHECSVVPLSEVGLYCSNKYVVVKGIILLKFSLSELTLTN